MKLIQDLKGKFDITDKGKTIEEYLGVKIDHNQDGSFRMYQPHLMKRIIKVIPEMEKATEHKVPAATSLILSDNINVKARKENWNYRSVIGMLNFLVNLTHPELAHAVHQCARFCVEPK